MTPVSPYESKNLNHHNVILSTHMGHRGMCDVYIHTCDYVCGSSESFIPMTPMHSIK
jgi:hypothetical protein